MSSQTPLRCSIVQDGACFENMQQISGFFEFDFLLDEALVRGKCSIDDVIVYGRNALWGD